MALSPKTFNLFLKMTLVDALSRRTIGMTDLPLLSSPSLRQQFAGHPAMTTTLEQLESVAAASRDRYVLIVQDPFTSYYDAQMVADLVHLVEKLDLKPVLLPFSPNGKPQHIKGFLTRFAKTAAKTSDFLNRVAKLGMPMIGVDPALVLCYRDEYREILGDKCGDFQVQLVHEWLLPLLSTRTPTAAPHDDAWYLFGHCTESTSLPTSSKQWADIFARFGVRLENVNVGCCGMAGTYGHESKNLADSKGIYALSWQQALQKLPSARCLTTGY